MQRFLPWDTLCSLLLQPPATAVCLWVFLHSVLSSGIEMHNIICWDQVIDLITEKPRELLTWSEGVSLFFLTVIIILPIVHFFSPLWSSRPSLTEVASSCLLFKDDPDCWLGHSQSMVIWFICVFQPNVSLLFMYWHLIGPYIYTERISKNQV